VGGDEDWGEEDEEVCAADEITPQLATAKRKRLLADALRPCIFQV
jgi:hypothetical protein